MTFLTETLAWLLDPAHWVGAGGIPTRLAQHLLFTLVTLVVAAVIAVPIGFLIGHTGRGRGLAVAISGAFRAIPTLGLLTLVALWVGIGLNAPYVALTVLAIPPILAGAYTGFEAIDRKIIDAARAVGMSEMQIVLKVELPLGLPLLIGGLRSATLQVVATATLAAYIADFGLGRYLFEGLRIRDYGEMLGGSILVILLAIVLEGLFALAQKLVVPRGVTAGRPTDIPGGSSRSRPVMELTIEEGNSHVRNE
ncbi:ABC transporter permease [Cryobacterium sp. TMT1-3]|uniref:ABC transporter permease n=1 Tax=Cryobacterium luteum TaxID=1424661 RepID=A0A1H8GNV2_9MICO|nr:MULTISPECIES: ABC transporter permease [Cryobacterium]TFB84639.1 ABC transporter permease [Cryobacterium luteum]TFC28411.1 ABC transporter permease [Cryobacterium sp. TMT1-3]SEN45656.1 osmoprotectant transport system permease protein [Cryobacterium luteum]